MNTLDEDVKIAERAMNSYMDEYKEASEIWKTLENKAQVTIAVAGVFLAAVFSFSRDAGVDCRVKLLLSLTLIAILVALLCALWVLKSTAYDVPFDSGSTMKKARELLAPIYARGEPGSRYLELISQLASGFEDSLKTIDAVNETKEQRLSFAYVLLVLASLFATAAAMTQLAVH